MLFWNAHHSILTLYRVIMYLSLDINKKQTQLHNTSNNNTAVYTLICKVGYSVPEANTYNIAIKFQEWIMFSIKYFLREFFGIFPKESINCDFLTRLTFAHHIYNHGFCTYYFLWLDHRSPQIAPQQTEYSGKIFLKVGGREHTKG